MAACEGDGVQVPGASEAAGHALLALAGPVGWAVVGVSLVGAAAYLRSRNAKHAETWPISPNARMGMLALDRWRSLDVQRYAHEPFLDRIWELRDNVTVYDAVYVSTVDRTMAVRVLAYSALLYQDLLRASAEPLPPVLPIVLHHGSGRWTAPTEVAGLAAPSGEFLAPYQPAQRYFLLDFGEDDTGDYTDAPLPHGRNLVAALVRLERSRSDEDARAVLGALDAWLSESENESLRRAFGEWIRRVYGQRRPAVATSSAEENRTEAQTMLRERVQEWMAAKWAEGHAEGQAEGQAQGQLELMRRQAARKFGDETAERLAERLEPVQDAARLAEIGEWLIECGSGEALLARLDRTSDFVPDGRKPEDRPPR